MRKLFLQLPLLLATFLLITPAATAQETASIGEKVHEIYKKNGIDKAITFYKEAKTNEKDKYNFDEFELNRIGYILMRENKLADAKKIFQLNMDEYPDAPNPADSFGDLMAKMNNREEALKYYRKSVELAEKSNINAADKFWYISTSKSKIARLEGVGAEFLFMVGNWKFEEERYNKGRMVNKVSGEMKGTSHSDGNAMVLDIHYPEVKRTIMMTYNAYTGEYEGIPSINSNSRPGFFINKGKIISASRNNIEFQEYFVDYDGKKIYYYHRFKEISDKGFIWEIDSSTDGTNWELMRKSSFRL